MSHHFRTSETSYNRINCAMFHHSIFNFEKHLTILFQIFAMFVSCCNLTKIYGFDTNVTLLAVRTKRKRGEYLFEANTSSDAM